MLKPITIQADQRGLLFHKGSYVKRLLPGTYRYFSWSQHTVVVLDIAKPFSAGGKDLQLFLQDDELLRELEVVGYRIMRMCCTMRMVSSCSC